MAAEYPYVPVAGKYVCAQCSIASLLRLLLIDHEALKLNSLGISRRQVPAIVKAMFRYRRLSSKERTDVLGLPAFGQFCLRVHRGYKVFDLAQRTTTKVFDAQVDLADIEAEIDAVRKASFLDFAPSLLKIDAPNRCYTESFIAGERSSKRARSDPEALFREIISGYLAQVIRLEPVETMLLGQYVSTVITRSTDQQLSKLRLPTDLRSKIRQFVGTVIARLKEADEIPIKLSFTHGDFSFPNFVYSSDGIAVIDWEDARQRSLLHDLYNYFITELYYRRTSSPLVACIDDAIRHLSQQLAVGPSGACGDLLEQRAIYRWLYYLERMIMLLCRQRSAGQADVIQRSIDIFEQYETYACEQHDK